MTWMISSREPRSLASSVAWESALKETSERSIGTRIVSGGIWIITPPAAPSNFVHATVQPGGSVTRPIWCGGSMMRRRCAMATSEDLPVLAIKDSVLFPGLWAPLGVGRATSLAAIEAATREEGSAIVVVAQRDAAVEEPGLEQLYRVGTRAVIRRFHRHGDTAEVLVQGSYRVDLAETTQAAPFLRCRCAPRPLKRAEGPQVEALRRELLSRVAEIEGIV